MDGRAEASKNEQECADVKTAGDIKPGLLHSLKGMAVRITSRQTSAFILHSSVEARELAYIEDASDVTQFNSSVALPLVCDNDCQAAIHYRENNGQLKLEFDQGESATCVKLFPTRTDLDPSGVPCNMLTEQFC